MRSAVLHLPPSRTAAERRVVLRAAIRQLERAEVYLAAVTYIDLDDRAAHRMATRLRSEVDALRRHLTQQRGAPAE